MELEHLGKRMQEARQGAGISQEEMGKRIDRTQGTISQWETQRREPVGLALIDDYCKITGRSLEFMVGSDSTYFTVRKDSPSGILVALLEECPDQFVHLAKYATFLLTQDPDRG